MIRGRSTSKLREILQQPHAEVMAFLGMKLHAVDVAVAHGAREWTAVIGSRELVAGLAEVVKYGAIRDAGLFRLLEERVEALLDVDEDTIVPVVAACVRHKAAVVVAEPFYKRPRPAPAAAERPI